MRVHIQHRCDHRQHNAELDMVVRLIVHHLLQQRRDAHGQYVHRDQGRDDQAKAAEEPLAGEDACQQEDFPAGQPEHLQRVAGILERHGSHHERRAQAGEHVKRRQTPARYRQLPQ